MTLEEKEILKAEIMEEIAKEDQVYYDTMEKQEETELRMLLEMVVSKMLDNCSYTFTGIAPIETAKELLKKEEDTIIMELEKGIEKAIRKVYKGMLG